MYYLFRLYLFELTDFGTNAKTMGFDERMKKVSLGEKDIRGG